MDRARPTNNLQWKGIDICIDLHCDCGVTSHADGFSFGFIQCPSCLQVYKLDHVVAMDKVSQFSDEFVPAHPLRASV